MLRHHGPPQHPRGTAKEQEEQSYVLIVHQEPRGPLRQAQPGSASSIQVGRAKEGWEPPQPPVLITTSTVQQQFNSLIQGNRRIGKLFCHPRQVVANRHSLARLCCPSICSPAPCDTPACQQANPLCLWQGNWSGDEKKASRKSLSTNIPARRTCSMSFLARVEGGPGLGSHHFRCRALR